MNNTSITGETVKKYLELFPDTPSLTLAKKIYKENELFGDFIFAVVDENGLAQEFIVTNQLDLCSNTGIEPLIENTQLTTTHKIYITDNTQQLVVPYPENIAANNNHFTASVYNLQGQAIQQLTITEQSYTLSTAHLPNGIYLYHFNQNGINKLSGKIAIE